MWYPRTVIILLLSVCFIPSQAQMRSGSPEPGTRPQSPDVRAKLRAIRAELQAALHEKSHPRIKAVVKKLRSALGPLAGVPEDPENYSRPIVTDRFPSIDQDFQESVNTMINTQGSRSELAQKNQMELRESGYLALGLMAAAEAGLPFTKDHLSRAAEELNYLLTRQQPQGFFAYPAYPGASAPQHLRESSRKFAAKHPEYIKDGFIVWVDPNGGSQFDTGVCGFALVQGYQTLRDPRYLKAALRSGDWAMAQSLSANWNYNAFSVWLLAKLYALTGSKKYLNSALEKAHLGVLPGQMENGRWVDQHNAKRVYHWIMVRALNELLKVQPPRTRYYKFIKERLIKAVENRAEDVLRDGAVSTESSVIALSEVLEQFGPNDKWARALTVLVNALHNAKNKSPYAMGVYLRYKAKKQKQRIAVIR